MRLDNYFRRFTDDLGYLDLKDSASYSYLKDLPLPIYVSDMSKGIISGDMNQSIELDNFLQGMLINIGADPEFLHNEEYKSILAHYLSDVNKYASQKAMEYSDEDINKALLILRGAYVINPKDNVSSYLYAKALWPMAYEASDEFKDDFIRESLKILQDIISYDENFSLSYFELGNIYSNLGEYIKARNYYNLALNKTDADDAREEVRDRLTEINDNADIEEALYMIGKSDYNGAIKKLTGLLSKTNRPDAYYYLGVAYQNLGQYENSNMAFENALDKGADFRELYNDYAISLFMAKREDEALNIIDEGLGIYPADPRLVYNKIQINLSVGKLREAKDDLDELLTYDDLSDEIKQNLEIIKHQFNF